MSLCENWRTPRDLYYALNREFAFTLDAAATRESALHKNFYTPEDDALRQPWRGVVFCNPPYGRKLGAWIARGYEESREGGATVVMLIPSRTDTVWWHDYAMKATEIRFIRGRLRFGAARSGAPFPSCLLVFRPDA